MYVYKKHIRLYDWLIGSDSHLNHIGSFSLRNLLAEKQFFALSKQYFVYTCVYILYPPIIIYLFSH